MNKEKSSLLTGFFTIMGGVFIKLPLEVREILKTIEIKGGEGYVVGGAIRNYLLSREINDYDITTSLLPGEIEKVFSNYRTIDIGKKFGTILLIYKNYPVEITTFRSDGKYIDGRRPEEVSFSKSLREDLKRRDFTINAMAYSEKTGYVDYFFGREDIKKRLIRTVGSPARRFSEDYLRILRAIRFASQLEFNIEEETFTYCKFYAKFLKKISGERIRDEFFKILMSRKPSRGIELLRESEILEILFPEISKMIDFKQDSPYHNKDVYKHTLAVLDASPRDLEIRLAALFHDMGKVETKSLDDDGVGHFYNHHKVSEKLARNILKRLNSPKVLIEKVGLLVGSHMIDNKNFGQKGLKRLIRKHGVEGVYKLLELQKADRLGSYGGGQNMEDILEMEKAIGDTLKSSQVYDEKQLAIDGSDVIELGYKEGKIIGEILSYVLDMVLEDESLNNREYLLKLVDCKFKDRRE